MERGPNVLRLADPCLAHTPHGTLDDGLLCSRRHKPREPSIARLRQRSACPMTAPLMAGRPLLTTIREISQWHQQPFAARRLPGRTAHAANRHNTAADACNSGRSRQPQPCWSDRDVANLLSALRERGPSRNKAFDVRALGWPPRHDGRWPGQGLHESPLTTPVTARPQASRPRKVPGQTSCCSRARQYEETVSGRKRPSGYSVPH